MKIKHGMYRTVFLIGNYAIKIPRISNHKRFIGGWYSNIIENNYYWLGDDGYACPVIKSLLKSLIIVMPRCKPLDENNVTEEDIERINEIRKKLNKYRAYHGDVLNDANYDYQNIDNYGWYKDKIVILDYGGMDDDYLDVHWERKEY